ncbi:MAG: COX15/CtaA family protein [Pseudanabaenaceae cyanobacterium]
MFPMVAPSVTPQSPSQGAGIGSENPARWLRWYFGAMAVLVWGLMALGSATRVMNAGLACPDWPLCFGAVVPVQEMNLLVFLEWFHRVVATSMGLWAIGGVGLAWRFRRSLPPWLPKATLGVLGLVMVQGVLGGLTVTELLRFEIVTAHLGTGLLFFLAVLAIFVGLQTVTPQEQRIARPVTIAATVAALSIYGQSLLGAVVASRWAALQCLGDGELCRVLYAHFWGIGPAAVTAAIAAGMAWRSGVPLWQRLGLALALLVVGQIGLGYLTYKLQLQVPAVTVAHQAIGALLLGTATTVALLSRRAATV